jgi:hypothetical protein
MSAVLSDDEFRDATSDEGIWQEVAARLKIAEEAEGEDRARGIQAIAFRELGEQWDPEIAKERTIDGRPALTVNHTNVFCRRVENTLRQQRPRIKCHPVGGGARIEDAQVVNGLIRHIETLSNAGVAYDAAGKSAVNIGWGYVRISSDYIDPKSFDQELKILPILNTFTVYMDPSAIMPAAEDAQWCIITETMKRSEYRIKYPTADNSEWRGGDAPGDIGMWDNKEEIRLAEYYRIHNVPDVLYQMNDGRQAYGSELPDSETMLKAGWTVALRDGKPIKRKTVRKQLQWFRINGTTIVDQRDLPGTHIPVLRCEGNVVNANGKTYRKGMVEDLMDPARMFNYSETMKTERYALAPKAPWVAYEDVIEGHPEWHSANQKAYSVLIAKAAHDEAGNLLPLPERQPPVQIEAGMSEWSQSAERNLMAVAGMPMENTAEEARVVSGNKYLARRQGERDLVHFQYYDNQTYMIMWVGLVLLELIPYYYDTQRMQRIIGDDGTPQMVEINKREQSPEDSAIYNVKNNLQLGRYDVVMDTGPGYQTKREEGTEAVLGLLGTPLAEPITKVGADLIVRNMDFAGADELADRLVPLNPESMGKVIAGLPKQAQAIVGSLQTQIQQMQQVIQQQALEIKYKSEIEKEKIKAATMQTAAKLETETEKSRRDDATKHYDIEVTRQTALDVAEINAAKQLLNTKAEQEHEEKQTDKLIEKGLETGMQKPKDK